VLVTGDELVRAGSPAPGQTRDAIGPLLPGLIGWAGGQVAGIETIGDDAALLTATVARAGGDVVVCCGSSATGPADHLPGALAELDATVVVNGVACRPGHPQLLGRLPGGRLVVGLPGNPFAALAAALTLLVPVIAALAGRRRSEPTTAVLEGEPAGHPRDTRLVPVRACGDGRVEPVGIDAPASLIGAARADALAVVPPGWRGEPVQLLALPT